MSLFSRHRLCDERPDQHDALLPREREVLALWDDGWAIAQIAAELGLARKTVKDITIAFDDRPDDHEAKMRSGSEELRARILQFHPHVILGGERHGV